MKRIGPDMTDGPARSGEQPPREQAMGRLARIRYQVAMSLDGYIAGPKGEADWILLPSAWSAARA